MLIQIFDPNWSQNAQSLEMIFLLIIFYIIFLLIMTIFLKLALMLVKSEENEFGTVFSTVLFIDLIFTLLGLFLVWWLTLILGLIIMNFALILSACPIRVSLRVAHGDLIALTGLVCIGIGAILATIVLERKVEV